MIDIDHKENYKWRKLPLDFPRGVHSELEYEVADAVNFLTL